MSCDLIPDSGNLHSSAVTAREESARCKVALNCDWKRDHHIIDSITIIGDNKNVKDIEISKFI